jgi:hypothetical protein
MNIKMDHREIGWGGMDWIDLAQDRDQWRVLVNMVMNLCIFIKCWGIFLVAAQLGASQGGLKSTKLV